MKLQRGDRVKHYRDSRFGTITATKEQGVAGSAVTYLEWVDVAFDDGTTQRAPPGYFKLVPRER